MESINIKEVVKYGLRISFNLLQIKCGFFLGSCKSVFKIVVENRQGP